MADRSTASYQSQIHVEDNEDTEDSESSSDTSSDSVDLFESELEISAAQDYNTSRQQCEVYSNPVTDNSDNIEIHEDLQYSNPQCNQNVVASESSFRFELESNKSIKPSEASCSRELCPNHNIENSGANGSHKHCSNKNTERSGTTFGLKDHCNKHIDQSGVRPDIESSVTVVANQESIDNHCSKFEIVFPHNKIKHRLNKHRKEDIKGVGRDAAIYMAAVIEYIAREVLDLALNSSQISQSPRINLRDLKLAIRCDEEMSELFEKLKED